jgi:hypothetical protein
VTRYRALDRKRVAGAPWIAEGDHVAGELRPDLADILDRAFRREAAHRQRGVGWRRHGTCQENEKQRKNHEEKTICAPHA